jgi:hypothetical protein
MDYHKAFNILEIDITKITTKDITLVKLKKKYHKLALQNHPDKNGNTIESTEKFRQIHEAYEYLKNELQLEEDTNNKESMDNVDERNDAAKNMPQYIDILQLFMKTMLEGKYTTIISKIIEDIVSGCSKITLKLLEDLDKDTCMNIYIFLSNNRSALHLNDSILETMREIVQQKFDNVFIYKLNPSLQDLLNNNIYKLNIQDQICYVPLWISESYFDISGCEIIALCEPEIPSNISIDEYNNIYVTCEISIMCELQNLIMNNLNYNLKLCDKYFEIQLENLYIKKEQKYTIKNVGLSKNNITDNLLDNFSNLEKADIIVTIKLTN